MNNPNYKGIELLPLSVIEAARAGEAGKGFAVVAEQIRTLSTGTKASSSKISQSLMHLEETSTKMMHTMEETLSLIRMTLDKVTTAGASISKISEDTAQLEENIQIIDTAMKDVEQSNIQLVDNMDQVSSIMTEMSKHISDSNEISHRMLSKYDESANNINSIETVVESLMCELGIGGFMGVEDLQPGMKFTVTLEDSSNYHGDIVERTENTLTVSLGNFPPITKTTECELQVTVIAGAALPAGSQRDGAALLSAEQADYGIRRAAAQPPAHPEHVPRR